MIELLVALAAMQATPAQPNDSAFIKCAFDKAGELATASAGSSDFLADEVVVACQTADGADTPRMTDLTEVRVRAAAIAVINRKRGLDGQPADAPIRLPTISTLPMGRLDIPDEIAPAVVPYLRCLIASAGVPVYTAGRESLIAPPQGVEKGSNCETFRTKARRDAHILLRRQGGRDKQQRQVMIEATLTSIDDFQRASTPPATSPEETIAPN